MRKIHFISLCLLSWLVLFILGSFHLPEVQETILDPQQERGKVIYTTGKSPSGGEIVAVMSGAEVPGAVLPCMNCHGEKGEGKPEGGVVPTNLTWDNLTKPYGGKSASGREYPPYDEKKIVRAITMGIDPGNNELSTVMPRYRMSRTDIEDLIAYLKILGKEQETGVDDRSIHIGVLPPAGAKLADMQEAIRAVVEAYFTEVNASGGVYDRNVELKFLNLQESGSQDEALTRFLNQEDIFALTASYFTGKDKELAKVVNDLEVPSVGTVSDFPETNALANRYAFYLYPGLEQQLIALANYVQSKGKWDGAKVAILFENDSGLDELARSAEQKMQVVGTAQVEVASFDIQPEPFFTLLNRLKEEQVSTVFYLGSPGSEQFFFQAASRLEWTPLTLLPGSFTGPDLFKSPEVFDGHIILSYPIWPSVREKIPLKYYAHLRTKYDIPNRYQQIQLGALGSAMFMTEMLKRTGRNLSRSALLEQIEKAYEVHTGLLPKQTFGPNRRIGSDQVFLVRPDLTRVEMELLNF